MLHDEHAATARGRSFSLYVKIFLSFLATCVLIFVGLAVFWNYYFTDMLFSSKKETLMKRSGDVLELLGPFQEGSIAARELRFGMRIIAGGIGGQVWLVDETGTILYSTARSENQLIPGPMDPLFIGGLKGQSGYWIGQLAAVASNEDTLTYYRPTRLYDKPAVLFLHTPIGDVSKAIYAMRMNVLVPLLFSLLAVGTILFTLSRKFARPLQQMNSAAARIREGDIAVRLDIPTNDEMGQLARSFNSMVEQLQQWEDTRQEFLANISHELRSPLTSLRGLIVAMNDKVIPADKHDHYLKICDQEVQRLQRLVSDLLDLARIQNGSDVFRPMVTDLASVVSDVVDVVSTQMERKGIGRALRLPSAGAGAVCAEVDPDRLAQILQNLLYNAIQFTPSGGRIDVELCAEGRDAVLRVRDTGVGMRPEELRRIWDRFYKADESRGNRTEGTGLGLTIVKHLVNAMHGTIEVRSVSGEGTEFTVRFPLAPPIVLPEAAAGAG